VDKLCVAGTQKLLCLPLVNAAPDGRSIQPAPHGLVQTWVYYLRHCKSWSSQYQKLLLSYCCFVGLHLWNAFQRRHQPKNDG